MSASEAVALDRLAVDTIARAFLLRADGPPVSCRSYRDDGGLVVVLKVAPALARPLSRRWAAHVMVAVEEATGGALTAGGLAINDQTGILALGFRGELPMRRHTDQPPAWQATASYTQPGRRRRRGPFTTRRAAA